MKGEFLAQKRFFGARDIWVDLLRENAQAGGEYDVGLSPPIDMNSYGLAARGLQSVDKFRFCHLARDV